MTHATTWMDFKGLMLSKKNPISKGCITVRFHLYSIIEMNKIIEMENRLMG